MDLYNLRNPKHFSVNTWRKQVASKRDKEIAKKNSYAARCRQRGGYHNLSYFWKKDVRVYLPD